MPRDRGVTWPALDVRVWPIEKLIPSARNARTHSAAQIGQIASSMTRFGWTMPVLADEAGNLIAGHGRVLAARELGWTEAPVMVAAGWSATQKRAYMLADNKLALNAAWDIQTLRAEVLALIGGGTDVAALGFSTLDVKSLASFGALAKVDTEPAAERYEVLIECRDETDQNGVMARFKAEGFQCKAIS